MRLIDVDVIYNWYKDSFDFDPNEVRFSMNDISHNLSNIPTATQWISCSERLPEIGEYVLCSQENGDVGEGKLIHDGEWFICYDQTCHGSYWVNAWMPLPEPYKEDNNAD